MNKVDQRNLQKSKHIYIQSNDPRFNYGFHPEQCIKDFNKQPEVINLSQYDYSFIRQEGAENKLPDEYYGVMARYSTGNPITKKEVKNSIKKVKKNSKKQLPVGMSVATGNFTVDFD